MLMLLNWYELLCVFSDVPISFEIFLSLLISFATTPNIPSDNVYPSPCVHINSIASNASCKFFIESVSFVRDLHCLCLCSLSSLINVINFLLYNCFNPSQITL